MEKALLMTNIYDGGLSTNLKEILEEIANRGGAGKADKDNLAVSQLTQALKEAVTERDVLQAQLNALMKANGKQRRSNGKLKKQL